MERILLSHPLIADTAVLGVEDATYGQRVGAVMVLKRISSSDESELNLEQVICSMCARVRTSVTLVPVQVLSPLGRASSQGITPT